MIALRLSLVLAALLCGACATGNGAILHKLDPQTSVTVTYVRNPMVFYRDNSGRAAFARNVLHMGPIEVNRMGSFRYYLWLGIWNTVDPEDTRSARDGFDSITIFADGEPLSLEVTGWTPDAIGATVPVYVNPVGSAADAYYAVTVDQLRLLAEAGDIQVRSSGTKPRFFEPWDDQKSARRDLGAFLRSSAY